MMLSRGLPSLIVMPVIIGAEARATFMPAEINKRLTLAKHAAPQDFELFIARGIRVRHKVLHQALSDGVLTPS